MIAFPCYTGSDAEPEGLRRLREAPGLVEDGVRVHSFMAQQHMVNPDYGVDRTYWKGHFVRELEDELVDLLVERMRATGRKGGQILIESLHGAAKETGSPSTAAVGFREAAFNLSAMGAWDEPADDEEGIAWTRETAAVMEPWTLTGGGYVNYMQADEPIERVRAAFGGDAFDRLQALKGRYDPGNALRRNQNIPPPRD
jgi:FAD/FMN-containing dehydrogenase